MRWKMNIEEAHDYLVKLVWYQGKEVLDQRNDIVLQYHEPILMAISKVKYPEKCPVPMTVARKFYEELLYPSTGNFDYTYGNRISGQIENVIELLKEHPETRRACMTIFNPSDLHKDEVPCATQLLFNTDYVNRRLDMTAVFRSNDVYGAFPADAYGFMLLQRHIADKAKLDVGLYYHFIQVPHIIENNVR